MKFYDKETRVHLETKNQDVIEQYEKRPERFERFDGRKKVAPPIEEQKPDGSKASTGAFGKADKA